MKLEISDKLTRKCPHCNDAACEFCASVMALRRMLAEADKESAGMAGIATKTAVCVTIGCPTISIRNANSRYMVAVAVDGVLQTDAKCLVQPHHQTFHSHSLIEQHFHVKRTAGGMYRIGVTWSCGDAQTVPLMVTIEQH